VIPRAIAAEVARDAVAQEEREAWLFRRIDAGAPLWGTYPPDEATLAEYDAHRAGGAR
jgi:regulator of RNase E activity RraA